MTTFLQMTGYEELLTVPEVAVLLRCSAPSIHRRIRNGQLPAIKSGDAPNAPVRNLLIRLVA